MLCAWEFGHPACMFGRTAPVRRMGSIFVAYLNRENTKKHESHEIFPTRISWFLLDSTKKSFWGLIPCAKGSYFFRFFRAFLFLSRFRDSIRYEINATLLFNTRNMSSLNPANVYQDHKTKRSQK